MKFRSVIIVVFVVVGHKQVSVYHLVLEGRKGNPLSLAHTRSIVNTYLCTHIQTHMHSQTPTLRAHTGLHTETHIQSVNNVVFLSLILDTIILKKGTSYH